MGKVSVEVGECFAALDWSRSMIPFYFTRNELWRLCLLPKPTRNRNPEHQWAEVMVRALIRQGVDLIFAYPGGCSMPMHQSLTYHRDELRTILPRHEQGGALSRPKAWPARPTKSAW